MRIAMIGPGFMSIPPFGWGAVESLMWDLKISTEKLGHEVVIFNSRNLGEVATQINSQHFDFIHLQYDDYAGFFNGTLSRPFAVTTHFGYINRRHKWHGSYPQIFEHTMKSPAIIALSPEIENLYRRNGFRNPTFSLRNGANTNAFSFSSSGNGKTICLGKIEPRKRQAELASFAGKVFQIDFVGPIVDQRFRQSEFAKHLGEWTKPTLFQRLTEYSTLVLLSDGEAAPLVVPEALAAGLNVVISETSSANLDKSLPFVNIIPNDVIPPNIGEILKTSCEQNVTLRREIRNYAESHFDWDVISREYVMKIQWLIGFWSDPLQR